MKNWNLKKEGMKAKVLTGASVAVIATGSLSSVGSMATYLLIDPWEGNENIVYLDVGGVPTACQGVTGKDLYGRPLIVGQRYNDQECATMNIAAVNVHEAGMNKCLKVAAPDLTKASWLSFTYNVGVGAFCRSTLLRLANAGDLKGACGQLSNWVFVKGRVVNGLVNRRVRGDEERVSERTVCMIGLDPNYKTPLFEKVYIGFKNWKTKNNQTDI